MDDYKTIFQSLAELAGSSAVPMHMPGHKRNVSGSAYLKALGAKYDVTEIEGFDDLHHPQGILKQAMGRAAALWGSDVCFFLVNGSTGGLLALLRAVAGTTGSGRLIMARNCHRAVYNAAELLELEPVYIAPTPAESFGFCGSVTPKSVELALRDNPGAPVILTSPTYEGVISNISEIAIICHMYGSPLLVDEAHGAHLDHSRHFTGGAVAAGADAVVQSVHKTLAGLNQSALLHLQGELISAEDVARQLSVFQTSSPSYPIMASIDGAVDMISRRGGELFSAWSRRLDEFDRRVSALQKLRIPGHSEFFPCQPVDKKPGYIPRILDDRGIYSIDRSKIVVSCEGTDTTGVELMDRLREDFGIYGEMAAGGYMVAMTGLLDKAESMERLGDAICTLDREIRSTGPRQPFKGAAIPPRRMPASVALREPSRRMALRDAKGRIAAEYVWAYPPGIPLVVPGEELTEELISSFIIQREAGVALRSTTGGMPRYINVIT